MSVEQPARRLVALLFLALVLLSAAARPAAGAAGVSPRVLRLVQTIPMPDVSGRIDHLALDEEGHRLFVAALGNNTIEVLDLRASRRVRTITGLHEPQDVRFIPTQNRLFATNGESGACSIFDSHTYRQVNSVDGFEDADNMRYDSRANRVYVGYGSGGVAALESTSGKETGTVRLAGHPESFQLERNGTRIFVNVPDAGQIQVVDRNNMSVISNWAVTGAGSNFPMALDEANHRLFVGCRRPARLLIYDTTSGKSVASIAIDDDADDLFYDGLHNRVYASCGAGFLDIIDQKDADHYVVASREPTADGARTSLFVPERNLLYVAAPCRGQRNAEIMVYAVYP
jgi:DNA-binding beta-propeller fold protein YncE